MAGVVLRRATPADLAELGRLGALLMGVHCEYDPNRFMRPGGEADRGYAAFLGTALADNEAAVFVAERHGRICGYVYAAIEPRNWKELREEAGFIHDLVVDAAARGSGVGRQLMEAALAWLRERGAARVILWTAAQNEAARRLFERAGFRRTMIEMTRELDDERSEDLMSQGSDGR